MQKLNKFHGALVPFRSLTEGGRPPIDSVVLAGFRPIWKLFLANNLRIALVPPVPIV